MKTLVLPFRFDGGAERAGPMLRLRQSGPEWIGDCPACEGSEALTIRPSRDGDPGRVVCVCRGACLDATALRAALSEILGSGPSASTRRDTRTSPDLLAYGGAFPRKRE